MSQEDAYQILAGCAVLVAVAYISWYVFEGFIDTDN